MKKIFALSFVVAMMIATTANAQIKFGLKGGVNVTNMSIDRNVLDADNRAGFFIGPTLKVSLPLTGLGIDASALYDQRSTKITVDDEDFKTIKQQSVQIPVNLRYGVGLGSLASVFVFAGPQFGFNLGDDIKESVAEWKWKSSNFSVNVGLGATVLGHLQVTANYNIACGTTGEVTVIDGAKSAVKGKNNAWQIGVAYYF